MKLLRLFLMVYAIGLSVNSQAVEVRGAPSCGRWIENRPNKETNTEELRYEAATTRQMQLSWLVGYLSGIAQSKQQNILKDTDNPSISLWMDSYCNKHPLDYLDDGGDVLAKELKKRMH